MTEVKRRYDSTRRRAAAEHTRRRLIESARRLFAERGYNATTIEAIAADAGSAPQTFYKVLKSKRGVLFALLDDMAAAADPAALGQALARAAQPDQQLALLVDYRIRLYTGGFDILEAVRAAAPIDADVAAMWAEGEARRRRNQQQLLATWHQAGALRADVRPAEADVILWALTGPDMYRIFVAEAGWPSERYRDWLTATLRAQIFGTGVRRRRR